MKRRQYGEAASRFEAAYAADPQPSYLFNAGWALLKGGRLEDAHALMERCSELTGDVEVTREAGRQIAQIGARLAKSRGAIRLVLAIPNAPVSVDGVSVRGPFPRTLWLSPGRHLVASEHPGHYPFQQAIQVTAGRLLPVEVAFEPRSAGATILVRSTPSGASVLLDGKPAGSTPLAIRGVAPGPHRVQVMLPGMGDQTEPVLAVDGEASIVGVTFGSSPLGREIPLAPVDEAKAETPLVKKWWFWTLIAVGAAGVATGVGLGVVYSRSGDAESAPPTYHVRF